MRQIGPTQGMQVDIDEIIEEIKLCHEHGDSFCVVTMKHKESGMFECDVFYDHPNTRKAALEVLKEDVRGFGESETAYLM